MSSPTLQKVDLDKLLEVHEDIKADGYVLYLRRSVPQRKKKGEDGEDIEYEEPKEIDRISIEQQREACLRYAEKHDIRIVKTFEEEVSAKLPFKRKVFEDMLSYVEKNKGIGVFSWAPDRLSRNALEAGMLIQSHIDGHIVDFRFVTYYFHQDSSGLEYLMMEFARAMGYSMRLSTAVLRGMKQKYFLSNKWQFRDKFGYTRLMKTTTSGERRRTNFSVPHERKDGKGEFEAIQLAFELRSRGAEWTYQRIADYINDQGFTGKNGKPVNMTKSKLGGDKKKLGYLKDPFYFGMATMEWGEIDLRETTEVDDEGNELEFVTAVSEEDFKQCQAVNEAEARPKAMKHDYLPFRGLILCGHCGRKISPQPKKNSIFFYCMHSKCTGRGKRKHAQSKSRSSNNGMTGSKLFEIVCEIFKRFKPSKRDFTLYLLQVEKREKYAMQVRKRDLKSIQSQKGHLTKQIEGEDDNLYEALRGVSNAKAKETLIKQHDLRVAEYNRRLNKVLEKEKKLLVREQAWTQEFPRWLELMKRLHIDWGKANPEQKKRIADEIFLELTITNGKLTAYRCSSEYAALEKANLSDGGR
ncbi:MAG: recombinase family protein [Candidatus Peribacteraceae bacterium]|nr:recombinase family protein [Candidatus Peribacteraceae bacterium]